MPEASFRPRRPRHLTRLLPLTAAMALALTSGASAAGLSFSAPQQLAHGDPNGSPYYHGGEPSITFDPNGDGHAYVAARQGIPAALGHNGVGVGYWASVDHGATWPRSGLTGSKNGGGDSEVEVLQDHSVLVADLEAADAAICISHDFAATFNNCSGGVTSNHQGPENDREWLTRGGHSGEVFITYHDFTAGVPIIEKSTDGGNTFTPCANVIDPNGPAAGTYAPQGGTLVSKPVTGRDGTVFIEFTTPDQNGSPTGSPLDHLYPAEQRQLPVADQRRPAGRGGERLRRRRRFDQRCPRHRGGRAHRGLPGPHRAALALSRAPPGRPPRGGAARRFARPGLRTARQRARGSGARRPGARGGAPMPLPDGRRPVRAVGQLPAQHLPQCARHLAVYVTFLHPLRPGPYKAWARGIDRAGNVELKNRTRNMVRFSVR